VRGVRFSDCSETLLDLICYEICRDRLSSETEAVLARHLAECPTCRKRVVHFRQLLRKAATQDMEYKVSLLFSRS
jgi:hypothetical protein